MAIDPKRGASSAVETSEWSIRRDLAACHRLIAHFGMSDLVFTHVSARLPDRDDTLLIGAYGLFFDEVRASDLVRIRFDRTIDEERDASINPAAVVIHTGILAARQDVGCVIHAHTVASMAVSAHRDGLLPLCQHAMKFVGRIGYHAYEGIINDSEQGVRLARDLGDNLALILRHHGVLVVGSTVAEAFHTLYHLEMACRVQVATAGFGIAIAPADTAVVEQTARRFAAFPQPLGQREWPGLLRLLDRTNPGYAL